MILRKPKISLKIDCSNIYFIRIWQGLDCDLFCAKDQIKSYLTPLKQHLTLQLAVINLLSYCVTKSNHVQTIESNFKLPIYVFQSTSFNSIGILSLHTRTCRYTIHDLNKLAMRSCQLFLTRQNVEHILVGQVIMLPTPQSNNLKSQMRGCCNKRIFYSSFFFLRLLHP